MKQTWNENAIGDLSGRTAVVTGANSGIGFETARALASHGAQVVLACRDPDRGRLAAALIADAEPGARVAAQVLDLSDLSSVRRFAESCLNRHAAIDLLINNAGIAGGPLHLTADGFERHFGTNHLGHFALTGHLLPALRKAPGARVVTVSSSVAAQGRIDLADLDGTHGYRFVAAYARSKLANLLFALELDRRAKAAGLTLASHASHPGIVTSTLLRDKRAQWGRPPRGTEFVVASVQRLFGQPAAAGALPSLRAATDPTLHGGEYVAPGGRGHKRGLPIVVDVPPQALDQQTARLLWDASAERTGVSFDDLTTDVMHTR